MGNTCIFHERQFQLMSGRASEFINLLEMKLEMMIRYRGGYEPYYYEGGH